MPNFQKKLQVFGQVRKKINQLLFSPGRKRIIDLDKSWPQLFFKTANAPKNFIEQRLFSIWFSRLVQPWYLFRENQKVNSFTFVGQFAGARRTINLVWG